MMLGSMRMSEAGTLTYLTRELNIYDSGTSAYHTNTIAYAEAIYASDGDNPTSILDQNMAIYYCGKSIE